MDKSTLQIVIKAKDEVSKELRKTQKELGRVSNELNRVKRTARVASVGTKNELAKIGKESDRVKGTVKSLIGTFQGLGAMRLFAAIGALLALRQAIQLVKAAMFTAAEFEKVMSDINTLFDDSGKAVARLEVGIRSMVKTMPVDPKELGSAAYQIVSAGITDTAEALRVLEASGRLAVAGLSTTAEAANILTSAINTFSADALSANEIANILFKTVKAGKTTVAELSQSFGISAPIIAEAGIAFKDFQAATAALTTTGLPASQAQQALRQAIAKLLVPTAEMEKLFEKIGVKTGRELVNTSEDIGDVFGKLKEAADESGISLERAVGSVEALNAVFGITGSVAVSYRNTLNDLNDATDKLDEAFLKQQATMTAQWQLIKNQLNIAMVDLGSRVFPIVLDAVNGMIDAITSLNEWYDRHRILINTGVIPAVVALTTAIIVLKTQVLILSGIAAIGRFFVLWQAGAIAAAIATNTLTASVRGFLIALGPIGIIATLFVLSTVSKDSEYLNGRAIFSYLFI